MFCYQDLPRHNPCVVCAVFDSCLEMDSLIGFPWSAHLDMCTCLEMASLIGFPWFVHFDLISLIFALDLQELSKVWKWLLWSVFMWSVHLIYRSCPKFGNGFFDRFSLIQVGNGFFDRFSLICTLDHRNCPQFGNGVFDRFSLICALDLQEGEWPGNYGRFDSALNTFWKEVENLNPKGLSSWGVWYRPPIHPGYKYDFHENGYRDMAAILSRFFYISLCLSRGVW